MQAQRAMVELPPMSSNSRELHSINTNLSMKRLEELAINYEKCSKENTLIDNQWIDDWITGYAMTKLFCNGIVRVFR